MPTKRSRRKRSDAAINRAHILSVASALLANEPAVSMAAIAMNANVARGTLYRHFPTRADLLAALNDEAREAAENSSDELRPAGELARATPTPLSVADVLNKVPPHRLGDQVVAEAHRIRGVSSAAVYLVDLDGVDLRRLAGPTTFPEVIPVPLAVGTEIPREGLPAARAAVEEHLPGAGSAPLTLRGRALGMLVAIGTDDDGLQDLAYEAAAAIGLADNYTDALDATRRTRATSAAAEIQQNLLPPRIVRTSGALLSGNVLPGYEIGGDWFDYSENDAGTWVGVADADGTGPRAASVASVALGAFRSARHQQMGLLGAIELMDEAVRAIGMDGATVSTTIGLWVPPTSLFTWVTCGDLGPIVVSADGTHEVLGCSTRTLLGQLDDSVQVRVGRRRLSDGDRLVLASDGVLERTSTEAEVFGVQGVVDAIRDAPLGSAAGAVSSIETTLRSMTRTELIDDSTLVVLVPVLMDEPDLSPAATANLRR